MKKTSAKRVKEMLDRNEGVRLINVLPEEQFRKKHIPGSDSAPLGDDRFLERVEELAGDKSSKVVVYCASTECDASSKATRRLESAGFQDVADLEGGVQEWEDAGYALEGQAVGA